MYLLMLILCVALEEVGCLSSFNLSMSEELAPLDAPPENSNPSVLLPLPPMGWNSWNWMACNTALLNEASIRAVADAMVERGLSALGYRYVNLDDCWMQKKVAPRAPDELLQADAARFPSGMIALGDYLHSRGLKFGIYADCGTRTCQDYPGSIGFEKIDAQTFTEWGVDYLKLDGCNADVADMKALYTRWSEALAVAGDTAVDDGLRVRDGRRIVFSCSWPAYANDVEEFDFAYISSICDLWRIFEDISANWESLKRIIDFWGDHQERLGRVVRRGAYNDPDILEIGNGNLSPAESQTHFSIWAILAAPLFLGNDVASMDPMYLSIVSNREVIAINQDFCVQQGERAIHEAERDVWVLGLSDGTWALAIVNFKEEAAAVKVSLTDDRIMESMAKQMNKIVSECIDPYRTEHDATLYQELMRKTNTITYHVRDIWGNRDREVEGELESEYKVECHGTLLVRLKAIQRRSIAQRRDEDLRLLREKPMQPILVK